MNQKAQALLTQLNTEYVTLHEEYENSWWLFRMGDHSQEPIQSVAEKARDEFRSSPANLNLVKNLLATEKLTEDEHTRLNIWVKFFELYQTPPSLKPLRDQISDLETIIAKKLSSRKEGYADSVSGNFIEASRGKMRMMVRTNPDESTRKACFNSLENLSLDVVAEYVRLVALRNEFAKTLGHEDFYAYRLRMCEGMTKKQVFDIFEEIYKKTKYALADIRKLETSKPGLRKPWNFGYMMSGSFTLEEDPYFNFDDALMRWGRSFSALGISFKGGQLQLDLLDRRGKYDNGFCHYPTIVNFNDGKRHSGAANFTCNVVYGQPGAGSLGMDTLFHEGGEKSQANEHSCSNRPVFHHDGI